MSLTPNEAAQRREAVVLHPIIDKKEHYSGDKIYSVTDKGLVIVTGQTRTFYPWNRVTSFSYHTDDVAARQKIQGF